jgi:hypothetical protein
VSDEDLRAQLARAARMMEELKASGVGEVLKAQRSQVEASGLPERLESDAKVWRDCARRLELSGILEKLARTAEDAKVKELLASTGALAQEVQHLVRLGNAINHGQLVVQAPVIPVFAQRLLARGVQLLVFLRIVRHSGPRIEAPPGVWTARAAEFLCSPITWNQVFKPLVADLQEEHAAALAARRTLKARWIRARYAWAVVETTGLHIATKAALQIWRALRGGS